MEMKKLEDTGLVSDALLELWYSYATEVNRIFEALDGDIESGLKALAGRMKSEKIEIPIGFDLLTGGLGGALGGIGGGLKSVLLGAFQGLINSLLTSLSNSLSKMAKEMGNSTKAGAYAGSAQAIPLIGTAISAVLTAVGQAQAAARERFYRNVEKLVGNLTSAISSYIGGTDTASFAIMGQFNTIMEKFNEYAKSKGLSAEDMNKMWLQWQAGWGGYLPEDLMAIFGSLSSTFSGLKDSITEILGRARAGDPEAIKELRNVIDLLNMLMAQFAGTPIGDLIQGILDQYGAEINHYLNDAVFAGKEGQKAMTEESEAYFKNIKDKKEEFFEKVNKDRERLTKATVYALEMTVKTLQNSTRVYDENVTQSLQTVVKLAETYLTKIASTFETEVIESFDEIVSKNNDYIDLLSGETIRTLEILAGVIQTVEDELIGKVREINWDDILGGLIPTGPGGPSGPATHLLGWMASMNVGGGGSSGGFGVGAPMGSLPGIWELIRGIGETSNKSLPGIWELIKPMESLPGIWELIKDINDTNRGIMPINPNQSLPGIWELIKPIIEQSSRASQPISNNRSSNLTLNIRSMYGDDLPATVGRAINKFLDQKGEIKIDFTEGQLLNLTTVDDFRGVH